MKYITFIVLCFLLLGCILFTTSSFAQEIDFTDESIAKKLLLGKKLHCQMDEQNYHGPEIIEVTKIEGKNFTGHSSFWCWAKGTKYTGKFKKTSLKWSQQEHTGCYCRVGNLNFFKDEKGNLKAKGNYGVGCGSNTFQGTIKCVVLED